MRKTAPPVGTISKTTIIMNCIITHSKCINNYGCHQFLTRSWESHSYCIVCNSPAACWWWLFQMWKVWQFAYSVFLKYQPDGTNACGSKDGEFAGTGSVNRNESYKIVFRGVIPTHSFRRFRGRKYHLVTMHSITGRWTERGQYHAN